MKTVPIDQAVEQTNVTQVLTNGGLGAESPWLASLQPRPQREILSESAGTETENYDCVPPKIGYDQ